MLEIDILRNDSWVSLVVTFEGGLGVQMTPGHPAGYDYAKDIF